MIVTVTLNASLRVQYEADRVEWGAPNQVTRVRYRAGGHGLAVARVLRALGHDVVAAGFAGGATGGLIAADLARSEVETQFTTISGESRRTLEVADTGRDHTTILNEPPPYITTEELGRFAADYRRLLTGATAVVLSGTLPAGLPPEIYGSLATYAAEAGVPAIIDAAGPALWYGASRHPALLIPGPVGADTAAGANGSAGAAGPAGTAGPAGKGREDAAALVARIRRWSKLPVAVGFGISNAEHVAQVAEFADAAVIGSAVVPTLIANAFWLPHHLLPADELGVDEALAGADAG